MNWIYIVLIVLVLLLSYFIISGAFKQGKLMVMNDAKNTVTIPGDKLSKSADFTYSIWIYVDNWANTEVDKVILNRANGNSSSYPKISLDKTANTLLIYANSATPTCRVNNIPIQRWVHIIVSVNQKVVDTYIDGKLVNTCIQSSIPNVDNLGDLVLSPGGAGFEGKTANLQYLPNAIDPQTAWNMYKQGNGVSSSLPGVANYGLQVGVTKDNVLQKNFTLF